MRRSLSKRVDWAALARLRLAAQRVADGVWIGVHESRRRGAGLEFAGHRSYVPGDDLRWLDQRALLRHERLLIKQFETETERPLRLIVDATASMGFRSETAPSSKLDFAALMAAALTRVAIRSGDPVGVDFLGGGEGADSLPVAGGLEAFERALVQLSLVEPAGHLGEQGANLESTLNSIGRRATRGSLIIVLSDLLEFGDAGPRLLGTLGTTGRQVIVAQILDPMEALFPLEGPVRLKASEGPLEIETNASLARAGYLEALTALQLGFREALHAHGGELVICRTEEDPVRAVRAVLRAAGGRGP
jgi:uncharacterized protein (DUF58 family)